MMSRAMQVQLEVILRVKDFFHCDRVERGED